MQEWLSDILAIRNCGRFREPAWRERRRVGRVCRNSIASQCPYSSSSNCRDNGHSFRTRRRRFSNHPSRPDPESLLQSPDTWTCTPNKRHCNLPLQMDKKKKEKKSMNVAKQQPNNTKQLSEPWDQREFVEYLKIVPKTSRLRNCLEIDNWLRWEPAPCGLWSVWSWNLYRRLGRLHQSLPNRESRRVSVEFIMWIKWGPLDWRTDVLVNAVDSLDVSCHGLDAGLLAAHFTVKQVISLQVEHASRLAVIDRRSSLLLLLLVMATIPTRVQGLIDQLIGLDSFPGNAILLWVVVIFFFLARTYHSSRSIRWVSIGSSGVVVVTVFSSVSDTVEMLELLQVKLMRSAAVVLLVRIRMEYIRRFVNNSWKRDILAGVEITAGRLHVISFRGRRHCGVQDSAGCQHGAHRRMIVI